MQGNPRSKSKHACPTRTAHARRPPPAGLPHSYTTTRTDDDGTAKLCSWCGRVKP